jgi:ribosomal protein L37AE/L43A
VSRLSFYSHLRTDVIKAVKKVEKKYRVFFRNIKIYRQENITINSLRYKIAHLEKLTRITIPVNQNAIKEYIKFEFEQLNLIENELLNFKKEFLTSIITKPKNSRKTRKDIPKIKFNLSEYNRLLKINRKLINKKLKNSLKDNKLNIIECPVCKKNLKIKNNNVGTIICPTCHFKFAADTSSNLYKVDYRFLKNNNPKKFVWIKDEKNVFLFNNQYQKFKLLLLINHYC